MSYYMGDFYNPRGDPGIGSFFGGLIKKAAGFIPGVGPIASTAIDALARRGGGGATSAITRMGKGAMGVVAKHPVLTAVGAAGAIASMGAGAEHLLASGGACPKGHHMSKPHKGVGSHCVRNRHMNFCNPRALRRATRRLHSFARHYRKVVGFVAPHKPKGRMYFKKRKRAA